MAGKLRIVQCGMGPIGCAAVRLAASKPGLEIVGAIDPYHSRLGEDIGRIAAVGRDLGVPLRADGEGVLRETRPDAGVHTTSSSLKAVLPQLEMLLKGGSNVVSSSEELFYPYRKQPELAARIHEAARKNGVSVLGTGVNPGFLMDAWPLFMTALCAEVREIRVTRVQDASTRRVPFQKKIGAGMTPEEFREAAGRGNGGHVGLAESIEMIASSLGWDLEEITETMEPVISREEVNKGFTSIRPGQVLGVKQMGYGWKGGKPVITLDFQATVGAEESFDAVEIAGNPDLKIRVQGGTPGDTATAAILINCLPKVVQAPPGLITMKDLIVHAFPGM